jgi:hypothetical protein
MFVEVKEETGGDDPFKQFTAAFEKADGPVCFRERVIGFVRFSDGDHLRSRPGMDAAVETFVVKVNEAGRVGCKCPFE